MRPRVQVGERPRNPTIRRQNMTERRFDGRVAVITGAGRGLGREYALLLAARGASVVVNDIGSSIQGDGVDAGPAQQVVDEIVAAGGQAVANTDSVATPQGGQAIIDAALQHYGRLDIQIGRASCRERAQHAVGSRGVKETSS